MTSAENNPVGFLQETCQKYSYRFPQYEEINSIGPDHCKEFTVKCTFEGLEALGRSRQKKQAKSEAAKAMIALMKENDHFNKLKLESGPKPIVTDNDNNNHVAGVSENLVAEVDMSQNDTSSESKNPISAINEFCQKRLQPPPQFVETSCAGVFVCECRLNGKKTYGHGSNKKAAKSESALRMCIEFNIKCCGVGYFLKETQAREDFQTEKNPISALQELCAQNYTLKTPEYTDLPPQMNCFVVKCTFNSISCEGRGTSKKIAKTEAARQVLAKLMAQSEISDGKVPALSALSAVLTSCGRSDQKRELEDFNIEEDEEEEEGEGNKKEDISSVMDVNLSLKLEALSIQPEHELKDVSDAKSEEIIQPEDELKDVSGVKSEETNKGGLQSLVVNKTMMQYFKNASARRQDDLKRKKDADDEAGSARKKAAKEIRELSLKKQELLQEKHQELSAIETKLKLLNRSL